MVPFLVIFRFLFSPIDECNSLLSNADVSLALFSGFIFSKTQRDLRCSFV